MRKGNIFLEINLVDKILELKDPNIYVLKAGKIYRAPEKSDLGNIIAIDALGYVVRLLRTSEMRLVVPRYFEELFDDLNILNWLIEMAPLVFKSMTILEKLEYGIYDKEVKDFESYCFNSNMDVKTYCEEKYGKENH